MSDSIRSFSMAEAKKIVEDLFEPDPKIYWADFLLNALVGWASLVETVLAPNGSFLQAGAFVLAVLGLYQRSFFIQRIVRI